MNKRQLAPSLIGDKWYSPYLDPIGKLSRHDGMHFSVFVIANLVFGQAGLWIGCLLFVDSDVRLAPFWEETISSGALYTFAIALTTSVLATVAFEFFDGLRNKESPHLWQHKVVWSVAAATLVFFQASLVGNLLSSPAQQIMATEKVVESAASSKSTLSTNQVQPTTQQATRKSSGALLQVTFWLISMLVAVQLFCLTRLPFIPDTHAQQRSEDVAALTVQAESRSKTSYDEKI